MSNTSGTAGANTVMMIVAGGFIGAVLFLGLAWAIIWLCAAGAYSLFLWRAWIGVLFAALVAAVFIVPPTFDDQVLDQQIAAIEAHELSVPPIDMTGRSILFLGGTRYMPWDCSDLCRAVVEYGTAEAVYFGHDRSLDLRYGNGPIDLTGRDVHSFPVPFVAGLPSDAASTPATLPESVDYIVLRSPSFQADALAALVPDVPTYGGVYASNTLWVEYMVFDGGDLSAFDPTTQTPIVTRFDYTRYSHSFPSLPFVALGYIDFGHHHNPGLSQRVNANTRELGAILCGPDQRPTYRACSIVLE